MKEDDKKNDRFESYPRPSEKDEQLKNQPEFINDKEEDSPSIPTAAKSSEDSAIEETARAYRKENDH